MASFAYLFERFPSLTQTFCYREVAEMVRQGMAPLIYSIRHPEEFAADCPQEVARAVRYLPEDAPLAEAVKKARAEGALQRNVNDTIGNWGDRPDKRRAYAAAWLGPVLKKEGVRHVHAHFAGIAARTAYWLKKFHGITFSFTGHANDTFCDPDSGISLEDLVREATFVATETEFSRDWLVNRFPGFATKVHRVYNGIDVTGYCQPVAASGKPLVLSVGRSIEKKGFPDLIAACALLRERGVEFECAIVGGGPLDDTLRAQVARLGLQETVRLTGPKPQEEVRELLARTRLFVLACVTESDGGMDNLPTVIAEAMASGVPVVSTRLAGVPEMIEHGKSGFLVGEKDPPALADAMAILLGDPQKAREFGLRGKALASERFATEVTTARLKRLLAGCRNVKPPWAVLKDEPSLGLDRFRAYWPGR